LQLVNTSSADQTFFKNAHKTRILFGSANASMSANTCPVQALKRSELRSTESFAGTSLRQKFFSGYDVKDGESRVSRDPKRANRAPVIRLNAAERHRCGTSKRCASTYRGPSARRQTAATRSDAQLGLEKFVDRL